MLFNDVGQKLSPTGWGAIQRYRTCLARMRHWIRAPAVQKKTPKTHWSITGVVNVREPCSLFMFF